MYTLEQIKAAYKEVGECGISTWEIFETKLLEMFTKPAPLVHVPELPDNIKPLDHNCPVCDEPLYAIKGLVGMWKVECSAGGCIYSYPSGFNENDLLNPSYMKGIFSAQIH
jgi:hypothetical protein